MITLRFDVSTNEITGAHRPPTKPPPANWGAGVDSSRALWLARGEPRLRLPLGQTCTIFRALYNRLAALSLTRSLTHTHVRTHTRSERNEEVESSLARREMRAATTSACSPRRVSALLGRQTHFASRCAVTHTCCAAGGPRADYHELIVSKEEVFFLVWCEKPSCRPINESAESANKSDFSVDGRQGIREERYNSCDDADSLTCHSVITELS